MQFKSMRQFYSLTTVTVCHMQSSGSSYLSTTSAQSTQNTLVHNIRVSQGSVATRFGCGKIFNDNFVPNFSESLSVKEF